MVKSSLAQNRYQENPKKSHLIAVKRILRDLKDVRLFALVSWLIGTLLKPDQHDDVLVIPEHVLVDEDEDPEEDEFEEEEDPQEEEDDMEVDIKDDENEPELTYPYEEMDPLNPPPPASESEREDAIEAENPIKHKDESIPTSVHENEQVDRDLYWTRVRAYEFYQEMIRKGFMFEERPNEAINVLIKDVESSSSNAL
nr:hypothetical protein [Tanacetum cinerariifolium]